MKKEKKERKRKRKEGRKKKERTPLTTSSANLHYCMSTDLMLHYVPYCSLYFLNFILNSTETKDNFLK
jgi:hypothetical protein